MPQKINLKNHSLTLSRDASHNELPANTYSVLQQTHRLTAGGGYLRVGGSCYPGKKKHQPKEGMISVA